MERSWWARKVDGTSVYGTVTADPYVSKAYPTCVFPKGCPESGAWEPCHACGQSGTYIDYGGPQLGPVAVDCKVCRGEGWIPKPAE